MIAVQLIHILAYSARIPLCCIRSPALQTVGHETSLLEFCQCLGSSLLLLEVKCKVIVHVGLSDNVIHLSSASSRQFWD